MVRPTKELHTNPDWAVWACVGIAISSAGQHASYVKWSHRRGQPARAAITG